MPLHTLKAVIHLQEDASFIPEQAERIAEIVSDLDVASVTIGVLDDMKERLSEWIDGLETRMEACLEETTAPSIE